MTTLLLYKIADFACPPNKFFGKRGLRIADFPPPHVRIQNVLFRIPQSTFGNQY